MSYLGGVENAERKYSRSKIVADRSPVSIFDFSSDFPRLMNGRFARTFSQDIGLALIAIRELILQHGLRQD